MAHSDGPAHSHQTSRPPTAAERAERRTAVQILAVILVPAAILTAIGLVLLWPGDASDHVRADVTQYAVEGVSFPTGTVTGIDEMPCEGQPGSTEGTEDVCATLTVRVDEGPDAGVETQVPISGPVYHSGVETGDGVVLVRVPTEGPEAAYQFSDFERSLPLGVIAAAFAIVVIAVARFRGLAAIVGLGFGFLILGKFLLPGLLTGESPALYALVGSAAIMFVVLYAAHGFSARTTTALAGTLFGLLVTAFLGFVFTDWAQLSGVGSEDDFRLASAAPDLKLSAVVMTGIVVAGLGILNDVTITQASAVWELHESSPTMSAGRLFTRAMRIGRDHIASTVYTIAFATAGAALPVLLLIYVYERPLLDVLQTEAISEEIARTLVGSIGLVLAVPLTTAIGVAVTRSVGPRADQTPPRRRERPDRGLVDGDW